MINDSTMNAIWQSVGEQDKWVAQKFIGLLDDHKRRFPTFKEERVAEIFIDAELKYKKAYCYKPIKSFTKSIHKANSFRSFAESQS